MRPFHAARSNSVVNEIESRSVEDILLAADRIVELIAGGRDAWQSDWRIYQLTQKQVSIIGEASVRLRREGFDSRHPELAPYIHRATDHRNEVVHEYDLDEYDDLWETLVTEIPEIAAAFRSIRDALGDQVQSTDP